MTALQWWRIFLCLVQAVVVVALSDNGSTAAAAAKDSNSKKSAASIISFELYTAAEIAATMDRWETHYSPFLYISTAQKDYQLPTAGGPNDCPFDNDVTGCLNRFLVLHPPNDDDDKDNDDNDKNDPALLPQVLWSGEVHGNERVGPTAVMEATQLLLAAVACHQLPRPMLDAQEDEIDKENWQQATSCRRDLFDTYGVTRVDLMWLVRLYYTRRLIVVPTANALGYYRNEREEATIDPNRDFPYDTTKDACMNSIAARTLNELYQDYLIQLGLTFHGGMEVIGYEWGAPSFRGKVSPDDLAQHDIAQYYSQFAGGFTDTPAYAVGPYVSTIIFVKKKNWRYIYLTPHFFYVTLCVLSRRTA
jgi:hypothetical protein